MRVIKSPTIVEDVVPAGTTKYYGLTGLTEGDSIVTELVFDGIMELDPEDLPIEFTVRLPDPIIDDLTGFTLHGVRFMQTDDFKQVRFTVDSIDTG